MIFHPKFPKMPKCVTHCFVRCLRNEIVKLEIFVNLGLLLDLKCSDYFVFPFVLNSQVF